MRDKKTTGGDYVPGDVLELLVEGGHRIMTQMINTIGCIKLESDLRISLVTMIVLKKKRKYTNCSDHRKITLLARTTKMVARMLRRIERKVEDVLGEDQFGFRRGKGTEDAVGMLRIISERASDIDEEMRACFIDR
jgi:hypothetical protein